MNNISISGLTIYAAIVFSLISTLFYLINLIKRKNYFIGRYSYYFSFFIIASSFVFLAYHFLTRDFRLSYVTAYSSSDLPFLYTISAIWAGQEGSFLLWAFLSLSLGIFLIKYLKDDENIGMFIYNLQILGLLILLVKQSPFTLLPDKPLDGKGLNPLLLNPWMAIHPPFMFLGYAAYGIPFTYAIVLALRKNFKEFYIKAYKWTIFSWVSMGIGIILGGFWAYETLGWGGYWGWDPVENASLVPWLLMTALIHGLILQKKYNTFYKSNYLLSIFSFIFVLYGTFLTRSGVLSDFSVHSFVDLGITGILLIILLTFLFFGILIFLLTFKYFPESKKIENLFSKDSIIIYGIILIVFSSFFVTLGTSSPIITKVFGEPSKVQNSFYVYTNIPIVIFILILLGIYPLIKNFKKDNLILSLLFAFFFSLISIFWGIKNIFHIFIIFLSILSIFLQYFNYKFRKVFFLHSGMILFIIGSLFSTGYDRQEKLKIYKGETKTFQGINFKFNDFIFPEKGKSYAKLEVQKGRKKFDAKPKFWINEKTDQIVSNPDIKNGFLYDLYISTEQYNPERDEILNFQKNERKEIYGINLTFKGFKISGEHSSGGGFDVLSIFEIEKDGNLKEISPKFTFSQSGFEKNEEILDEGKNIKISVEKLDATTGTVFLKIIKEGSKPYIILSVMLIPLINLVWFSSILILLMGTVLLFKK